MYDKIQMVDSKGETLAKIAKKKAKCYIDKGLVHYCTGTGAKGGQENQCIQLEFEPKDNNSGNTIYHTADKKNICVKCGRGDYRLMQHHIVECIQNVTSKEIQITYVS